MVSVQLSTGDKVISACAVRRPSSHRIRCRDLSVGGLELDDLMPKDIISSIPWHPLLIVYISLEKPHLTRPEFTYCSSTVRGEFHSPRGYVSAVSMHDARLLYVCVEMCNEGRFLETQSHALRRRAQRGQRSSKQPQPAKPCPVASCSGFGAR